MGEKTTLLATLAYFEENCASVSFAWTSCKQSAATLSHYSVDCTINLNIFKLNLMPIPDGNSEVTVKRMTATGISKEGETDAR
jgi:hypothetical protein